MSVPVIQPTGSVATDKGLSDILTPIVATTLTYIYWFLGLAALLYLVWAGFKYITAGGDTKKAGEARTGILNAVIGIAVIVAAYAITTFGFGLGKTINDAVNGTVAPTPSPQVGSGTDLR